MSTASALLSSIAPAAPATSQGSAAVDVSAFEGLLASMMDGNTPQDGETDAARPTEKAETTDAALAGAVVPAQTLPPAPQPILLIPAAAPAAQGPVADATDETAPVHAAPVAAPATTTPLPAGKTIDADPQVRPAVKTDAADDAQVQPASPTGADVKAAPVGPQTQPPVADEVQDAQRLATPNLRQVPQIDGALVEVAQPPVPDAAVTPARETSPPAPVVADKAAAAPQVQPPIPVEAETAAAAVAALETDKVETPELTKGVTPSIPDADRKPDAARPQPEAPPLRPLAERSSRPVETNAAVNTSAPSGSALTVPASAAAVSAAPAVDTSAPRAEATPVEAIADLADTTSDAPLEAPAPDAAPSAQTAQAARETLVPTMSRAAVEATAQIAAQILKRLDGRSTRFEMSLTPDDLGRVDIKLDIDSEGRLAARLAFDNPAAAADLKGRTDELRRQLEQQGFHLAEDAFEFSQRDSGSSAFDRGQDARQGQDRGQSRAFAAASRLNAETDTVAQPSRWTALSLTPAGVDMKV